MYASVVPDQLSQGDIISKVLLLDSAVPDAPSKERDVIILSHDCEIDKRSSKVVLVAGVVLLSEIEQISPGISGDIRMGRIYNVMYLAPHAELKESCVDFRYIFRVAKQSLIEKLGQGARVISLSEEGKQALCVFFERYLFRNVSSEVALPSSDGEQQSSQP
jgi:hypothetical protein